jgi:hypothetical protein
MGEAQTLKMVNKAVMMVALKDSNRLKKRK